MTFKDLQIYDRLKKLYNRLRNEIAPESSIKKTQLLSVN